MNSILIKILRVIFTVIILLFVFLMTFNYFDKKKNVDAILNQFKNCNSEIEVRSLDLGLGTFHKFNDNFWIGIWYKDSHIPFGWSKSIALLSDGSVYQSTYHFCGCYRIYKMFEKQRPENCKNLEELHRIFTSETLTALKQNLLKGHFKKLKID